LLTPQPPVAPLVPPAHVVRPHSAHGVRDQRTDLAAPPNFPWFREAKVEFYR